MKPWWWRRFVALMGFGAAIVSPWLSGTCILLSIGVSLDELRYGIAWDYAQVLDRADLRPYAMRMRVAGGFGLLALPALWAAWLWRERESWRLVRPRPRSPHFLRADEAPRDGSWSYRGQPPLTVHRFRRLRVPPEASLLVVADPVGRTLPTLIEAVHASAGPLLIVDLDGALFEATATRRTRRHPIARIAPFGGGLPWNPLAAAWTPHGIDDLALKALAERWFPERRRMDRALLSQVHTAFAALVHAADDTLRAAGERVPPAPGDLCRLLAPWGGLRAAMLTALAEIPALRPVTRDALRGLAVLDVAQLADIDARLAEILSLFARSDLETGTRGHGFSFAAHHDHTIYLHVPYARRADAVPVIEAFIAQWRAAVRYDDVAVVVHGLDHFPRLPSITAPNDDLRYIASATSLAALLTREGDAAAISRRFACVAWQAGDDLKRARREAGALDAYLGHRRTSRGATWPASPGPDDLRKLRRGEQLIVGPGLSHGVRCPVLTSYRRPLPPPCIDQGDAMPVPKSLISLVTSLLAACAEPAQTEAAPEETAPAPLALPQTDPCPLVWPKDRKPDSKGGANLGPKRFCLEERLFNGHLRPTGNKIGFVLDWPTLEPLPLNFDYKASQQTFLSTLRIRVKWIERLSDEAYRQLPRRWVEPSNTNNIESLKRPTDNLHLRIKGESVHGLTPYYADLRAIRAYYDRIHGPNSYAARPENQVDWFVDMGNEGIPRTVIKCSVQAVPNGVRLENGRLVHLPEVFRRAACEHDFVLPEYKATVNLSYQRLVLPDWKRIEDRIRSLLHSGEIN